VAGAGEWRRKWRLMGIPGGRSYALLGTPKAVGPTADGTKRD